MTVLEGQATSRYQKLCPFCAEVVLSAAIRCKHCQSALTDTIDNQTFNTVKFDPDCPGLGIRTNKRGAKWLVRYRFNGERITVTIGDFDLIPVLKAREIAVLAQQLATAGVDPTAQVKDMSQENQRRSLRQVRGVTLGDLYEAYAKHIVLHHSAAYCSKMDSLWERFLRRWQNRLAKDINRADVRELHIELGQQLNSRTGKPMTTQANHVLELLSVLYNKGRIFDLITCDNPAVGIEKFRKVSRDRYLKAEEIELFFNTLASLKNESSRDFYLLALFTGARKSNIIKMRWDQISFNDATLYIPADQMKNGEAAAIPLIPESLEVLNRRRARYGNSKWVFPGLKSVVSLRKVEKDWKIIQSVPGLENLRIHDLRRSLGSWMAICGISLPIIGKALSHRCMTSTQIYARLDTDSVRAGMDAAIKRVLKLAAPALANDDQNADASGESI